MPATKYHVYPYGKCDTEGPVFTTDGSRVYSCADQPEPLFLIDRDRVLSGHEGSPPSFYIRCNLWYEWKSGDPKYYFWPVECSGSVRRP